MVIIQYWWFSLLSFRSYVPSQILKLCLMLFQCYNVWTVQLMLFNFIMLLLKTKWRSISKWWFSLLTFMSYNSWLIGKSTWPWVSNNCECAFKTQKPWFAVNLTAPLLRLVSLFSSFMVCRDKIFSSFCYCCGCFC